VQGAAHFAGHCHGQNVVLNVGHALGELACVQHEGVPFLLEVLAREHFVSPDLEAGANAFVLGARVA